MIWFIIGLIIFLIITIRTCCDEWYDWFEKVGIIFVTLLVSGIGSCLVLLTTSAIMSTCVEADYTMASDTEIIALKDGQSINGHFYIMGGYVNEDLYYYYATETEFGYKTEKVKANGSYIKYTNGETHIEKYKGSFKNGIAYLFGLPMYNNRYVIYCPEGTITNEFCVDLE